MTTTELINIKVISPFSDKFYICICKMEMQYQDNRRFMGGNLVEVITEAGYDLTDYLKEEKLEMIEQECLEVYEG